MLARSNREYRKRLSPVIMIKLKSVQGVFVVLILLCGMILFLRLYMREQTPEMVYVKKTEIQEAESNKERLLSLQKMVKSLKGEREEMKKAHADEKRVLHEGSERHGKEVLSVRTQLEASEKVSKGKDAVLKALEVKILNISRISDELLKENKHLKTNESKPFLGRKLVHFDLKGAPPRLDYLIRIMKFSKQFGADGFLIEYEDMFPWGQELSFLRSKHAYTKAGIRDLLKVAAEERMIVVPLIQTFGHLEFVLKHKKFAHLRADKEITNTICPINNGSVPLVKKMIEQLLQLHPDAQWIHLGGDEVWNLKTCAKCKSSGKSDFDLYTHHMIPLFKHVKTIRTNTKPIIWDDMMRRWDIDRLKMMAQHMTPMVWGYVADLSNYHNFPDGMWHRFASAFKEIWFASSFKGALKPWSNFVPTKQHLENHLSWLKIIAMFERMGSKVTGIALTGWSRFDHYGPLCELLPSGIPTLALCLTVLLKGKFNSMIHKDVSKSLKFEKPFKIGITNFKGYTPESPTYPGSNVYKLVGSLEKAIGWNDWSNVRKTGWTRPYQQKKNFLSFYQLNTTLYGLQESNKLLKMVKIEAPHILMSIFDEDTLKEWIEDKVDYHINVVRYAISNVTHIMKSFTFK